MGDACPISKEANQGPPDSLYQTQWEERLMGSEDEEERHFCMLMESLGASNVFEEWVFVFLFDIHIMQSFVHPSTMPSNDLFVYSIRLVSCAKQKAL